MILAAYFVLYECSNAEVYLTTHICKRNSARKGHVATMVLPKTNLSLIMFSDFHWVPLAQQRGASDLAHV